MTEFHIDEREPEKKYYLKHKFLSDYCGGSFLNQYLEIDDWILDNKAHSSSCKTQFTQAEIDRIKENYNTTLDDFEQIEVEE